MRTTRALTTADSMQGSVIVDGKQYRRTVSPTGTKYAALMGVFAADGRMVEQFDKILTRVSAVSLIAKIERASK